MSAQKQKGTAWETAIVNLLNAVGWHAWRKVLSGSQDKGDIGVSPFPWLTVEAKNARKYDLPGWVAEAETEAVNAKVDIGVVWMHRTGKSSPEDGFVVMSGKTFLKLLSKLT